MIDVALDVSKHVVRLRKPTSPSTPNIVVLIEVDETELLALVTQLQKCVDKAHGFGWNLHDRAAEPDPPAEPAKPLDQVHSKAEIDAATPRETKPRPARTPKKKGAKK